MGFPSDVDATTFGVPGRAAHVGDTALECPRPRRDDVTMIYVVQVFVLLVAVIVFVAFAGDPMELGRNLNQSFTRGLDTIFGERRSRHRRR